MPIFYSVSLYDQSFSRYKVVENPKRPEWPQNDITHLSVKSSLYTLNTHPDVQISLLFALRSLVFRIIEVFAFPIGYNGEIQKSLTKCPGALVLCLVTYQTGKG